LLAAAAAVGFLFAGAMWSFFARARASCDASLCSFAFLKFFSHK
jgi:hypothetical protein